ncbi:hypothetical protein AGOR_G00212630 [Albula goreensis]|uniref:Apolipoprotein C-II n=1 Tax=Albula goreensis TaxID=1534307 RepID=A0A8T3CUK9_9TELE|nr:hypothetical protein AGOR_G00212630 [Albula goreensis]
MLHTFWECPNVIRFWEEVNTPLIYIYGPKPPRSSPTTVHVSWNGETIPTVSMNKLLVITLLIGLLSFGTQGFRVPRQAEGEEVAEAPAEGEVHHEEHAPAEEHHEVAAEEHHEAPAEEHHEAPAEEHHEAPAEEHHEEHPEVPEHHGPEAPEEAAGPLTKVTDAVRAAWSTSVDTATGWIESVKGWNLEEKAKTLYDDTTNAVTTYSGILQDQMYHFFYTQ